MSCFCGISFKPVRHSSKCKGGWGCEITKLVTQNLRLTRNKTNGQGTETPWPKSHKRDEANYESRKGGGRGVSSLTSSHLGLYTPQSCQLQQLFDWLKDKLLQTWKATLKAQIRYYHLDYILTASPSNAQTPTGAGGGGVFWKGGDTKLRQHWGIPQCCGRGGESPGTRLTLITLCTHRLNEQTSPGGDVSMRYSLGFRGGFKGERGGGPIHFQFKVAARRESLIVN